MILTGEKIKEEVDKGRIFIKPFNENLLNPNSYNYRLGDEILEVEEEVIDPYKKCSVKKVKLTKEGYLLKPNKLYLGSTLEEIGSDKYVTQLIGRSSIGRLGLFLQITAPLEGECSNHCWTLELKTVQPLVIYPYMKIGQISFWKKEGKKSKTYKKQMISKCYESRGKYDFKWQ